MVRGVPHVDLIPKAISLKAFLDHFRFRKSQEGLKTANPVARSLRVALHAFLSSTKLPRNARGRIIHGGTGCRI